MEKRQQASRELNEFGMYLYTQVMSYKLSYNISEIAIFFIHSKTSAGSCCWDYSCGNLTLSGGYPVCTASSAKKNIHREPTIIFSSDK